VAEQTAVEVPQLILPSTVVRVPPTGRVVMVRMGAAATVTVVVALAAFRR